MLYPPKIMQKKGANQCWKGGQSVQTMKEATLSTFSKWVS